MRLESSALIVLLKQLCYKTVIKAEMEALGIALSASDQQNKHSVNDCSHLFNTAAYSGVKMQRKEKKKQALTCQPHKR